MKKTVAPSCGDNRFSLLDMEFFGIDHRPQKNAEVVFVALGEAVLGDDVGGAGVDEQVEVMLGFGDFDENVIAALLMLLECLGITGLLEAVLGESVVGHVLHSGLLADGALGQLRKHDEAKDTQKGEDNGQLDGGIKGQGWLFAEEHEQALQKEQEEQESGDNDDQNIDRSVGTAEVGAVKFPNAVVGVWGRIFDFHSFLLSKGVHYIRHQKMAKSYRFCEKNEKFKFGFVEAFGGPITSVGSDALVAPKPQTFCSFNG